MTTALDVEGMSRVRGVKRAARAAVPVLDPEVRAMLDRVRQVFGDEILAGLYERARNAAIRGAVSAGSADASSHGSLRLVSNATDDGFVRALRNELDRLLTRH